MPQIRVLPDILVKKIAAGEVIERPASVVKELMENAVDAGATRIEVAVEQGGGSLIRVADDGCGMSADDLRLAVTSHATSKLVNEDDLFHIETLGFRGEALASVGSVARLRMLSRPRNLDEGAEIVVEAEEVYANRAAGCPVGTVVEVRDLFFNVPARRKFLRAAGTEYGHVHTQFARIALAHPHIAFDLKNNGRSIHQLSPADSRRARLGGFYSRELAETLLEFDREEAGLRLEGYAAPPADARSSTNWQLTFLNGRYIRDKNIQHAIRESFRGLIDPHRHPVVFLFLTIDPQAVDVNVHPTKIEVRWQDARLVHSQVLSALRETLQRAELAPALSTHRGFEPRPAGGGALDMESRQRLMSGIAEEFKQTQPIQPDLAFGPGNRGSGERSAPWPGRSTGGGGANLEAWREAYRPVDSGGDVAQDSGVADAGGDAAVALPSDFPSRGAIQLHNTYLVCETDDGMMIIDQHALHERVLFEQFKQRIASGKLESQRLLLPESLHVSESQLALLDTFGELFERVGLEIARFGADSVAIHAVPTVLKEGDVVGAVRDLFDRLEQTGQDEPTETILYDLLSMMACKAAVKAGDALTREEIDALIAHRDMVEKSSNCPHGRPTTLRLTVKDLERQFKRT